MDELKSWLLLFLPLFILLSLIILLLWNWKRLSHRTAIGQRRLPLRPAEAERVGEKRLGTKKAKKIEAKQARQEQRAQLEAQREHERERQELLEEELDVAKRKALEKWKQSNEHDRARKRQVEESARLEKLQKEQLERVYAAERNAARERLLSHLPSFPSRILDIDALANNYPPLSQADACSVLEEGISTGVLHFGIFSQDRRHFIHVTLDILAQIEAAITHHQGRIKRSELESLLLGSSISN